MTDVIDDKSQSPEVELDSLNKSLEQDVRSFPEFGIICSFLERFGTDLGICLTFNQLADLFTIHDSIPRNWETLHIKLLGHLKRRATQDKWINILQRFISSQADRNINLLPVADRLIPSPSKSCTSIYLSLDLQSRMLIFLELLECQFEKNENFKTRVNKEHDLSCRKPFGSDLWGKLYWLLVDREFNFLLYREDSDEETLTLVASTSAEMLELAESLESQCPPDSKLCDLIKNHQRAPDDLYSTTPLPAKSSPSKKLKPKPKIDPEPIKEEPPTTQNSPKVEKEEPKVQEPPEPIKEEAPINEELEVEEKPKKAKKKVPKSVETNLEVRRSGRQRKPVEYLQLEEPKPRKSVPRKESPAPMEKSAFRKANGTKKSATRKSGKKNADGDASSDNFSDMVDRMYESEVSSLKDDWDDRPESDFDPENVGDSSDLESVDLGRNLARQRKRMKEEQEEEETPCQFCQLSDRPEWLLLCDKCDLGHHAMCLSPPLRLIPAGDWFCPKCCHLRLVAQLKERSTTLAQQQKDYSLKSRMEERLKYIDISMSNIITASNSERQAKSRQTFYDSEDDSEEQQQEEEEEDQSASSDVSRGDPRLRKRPKRRCSSYEEEDDDESDPEYNRKKRRPRRPAVRVVSARKRRRPRFHDEFTGDETSQEEEDLIIPRTKRQAAAKQVHYNVNEAFKELDDVIDEPDDEEEDDEEKKRKDEGEEGENGEVRPPVFSARPQSTLGKKRRKGGSSSDEDFRPDSQNSGEEEEDEEVEEDDDDDSESGTDASSSDASWKQKSRRKRGARRTQLKKKKRPQRARRRVRRPPRYSSDSEDADEAYQEDSEDEKPARSSKGRRGVYAESSSEQEEEGEDEEEEEEVEEEEDKPMPKQNGQVVAKEKQEVPVVEEFKMGEAELQYAAKSVLENAWDPMFDGAGEEPVPDDKVFQSL